MNVLPAGFSSEEEDDDNEFLCDFMPSNPTYQDLAREICEKRLEFENELPNVIYRAIVTGNIDELLNQFETGFDIELKLSNNYTPLYLAAIMGNDIIVKELLNRGANATYEIDGYTTLMAVCNREKKSAKSESIISVVKQLIEKGVNVTAIDNKRRTALMFACEQGFIDVVKYFFSLDIEINLEQTDNQLWTLLFYAVNGNSLEVVKFLLDKKVNVDHQDIRKNTVKYYAQVKEYDEILNLLPNKELKFSAHEFEFNFIDYENMINSLQYNRRPDFKTDIPLLLIGMQCDTLIPLFTKSDIDLVEFLSLDDGDLKELGVKLSFQRNQILNGLYLFHQHSWRKSSIPSISKDNYMTTYDIQMMIITAIKHVTVLDAGIYYLLKNVNFQLLTENEKRDLAKVLAKLKERSFMTKHYGNILQTKAIQFDRMNEEVDLITENYSRRKNMLKKKLTMFVTGISVLYFLSFCKNRFW